jgi:hypothetical protein
MKLNAEGMAMEPLALMPWRGVRESVGSLDGKFLEDFHGAPSRKT